MLKLKFLIFMLFYFMIYCKKVTKDKRFKNSAVYAIQGRRSYMEDRFFINERLNASTNVGVFSLFDGHGGDYAAEFAKNNLMKTLCRKIVEIHEVINNNIKDELKIEHAKNYIKNNKIRYHSLIKDEILRADQKLSELLKQNKLQAGTTALIVIIEDSEMFVANVGDSRAVMCNHSGKTVPLSYDHHPNDNKEMKRIKDAGGFVKLSDVWRVNGVLAMSRSLGDFEFKPKVVTAEPDVLKIELSQHRPQFIILASDGLWDVFTNEEAVQFVKSKIHESHFGAKSLAIEAHARGSVDNITVIVVVFRHGKFMFGLSK